MDESHARWGRRRRECPTPILVPAKVQRRRFTAAYRLRIVRQADACKKPSHLTTWRRQREQGELVAGRARQRGPKPLERVKQLEGENRRLQRQLHRAETIITLQKKVAEILGIPLKPLDIDETD